MNDYDEKIVNLDSRIMYLEDSLQQLSMQMMKKDRFIEILQEKISGLEEKMKDMDERKANVSTLDAAEERPPHY